MAEENKSFEKDYGDEPLDYTYRSITDVMSHVIKYIEYHYKAPDKDVLKTSLSGLDFQKDDLVVLASRPSIGKTSFVLSLINKLVLEEKIPVGLIEPDLLANDIGERLLSINTGIQVIKIRSGMLKVDDVRKIQDSVNKLLDTPFFLLNEPNCSFKELKRNVINMTMENHIQLLVVDGFEYLQDIIDYEDKYYYIKLTYFMSEFKRLAVELHIPIMLVMDIPKSKNDNEPSLSAFKRYMIVPDKADKVLFLHRERLLKYTQRQNAKLIIAKNNCGPVGDINMYFYPSINKFSWRG